MSFQLLRLVGASQLKLEEASVLGRVLEVPDGTVEAQITQRSVSPLGFFLKA